VNATKRIQLRRTKGWSIKAESANYAIIDRRGSWGNHWTIHPSGKQWIVLRDRVWPLLGTFDTKAEAQTFAVGMFRRWLTDDAFAETLPGLAWERTWILGHLHLLAGRDLCCWCREDTACHADVYFEVLAARTTAGAS
jgi:hypothetical protein